MTEKTIPAEKSHLRKVAVEPPAELKTLMEVTDAQSPVTSKDLDNVWDILTTGEGKFPAGTKFSVGSKEVGVANVMWAVCQDTAAIGEFEKASVRLRILSEHPDCQDAERQEAIERARDKVGKHTKPDDRAEEAGHGGIDAVEKEATHGGSEAVEKEATHGGPEAVEKEASPGGRRDISDEAAPGRRRVPKETE